MQLPIQLPFGILCILFTHCARVKAVCPTLPCEETVPVYGVDPKPLYTSTSSSPNVPVSSTTPPVTTPSSTSTTPLPSTTSSSATPSSTSSVIAPATTPISAASAEPTVNSSPSSSTGVPTVTSPSSTAASSIATSPVLQSTAASSVSSARLNSSASVTVPASITQCGSCTILADQVQVYYWPTASVRNDCPRGVSVSPFQTSVTYASNASSIVLAPRVADIPTIAVVDGHTFTFPSLYVSVIGGISVSDSCGLIGSAYTNPPPVAVQGITTASYSSWPSTCRPQGQNAEAVIDTLALSDIACPTWGLSNPFTTSCDGSSYLTESYGQPYNPVILVPTQLLSIDPAWGACTANTADALLTLPCGIYDPPKALQTAAGLLPFSNPPTVNNAPYALMHDGHLAFTAVNDPSTPIAPTAAPAETGSPTLPKPTTVPSGASSDLSEDPSNDDPGSNGASDQAADLLKLDPIAPSTEHSDDSSQTNAVQQGDSSPAPDSQQSDSSDSSGDQANSDENDSDSDTSNDSSQESSDQAAVPLAPTTIELGGGAQSQSIGAIINGALGGSSVPVASPAFTPHAITALGQTISITDPSAVPIAGSTLSVGGPALTSDGNYFSLAPSGKLVAGKLAVSPEPSSPLVLSIAGSKYAANAASQFVVAGQTLTPGGQIAVSSTLISLNPSAKFAVVGGITQTLTTPTPSANAAVLTFAGSTYTANAASQFVIAGQTLAPGGTITASNTPIALPLGSSDIAVIGTSTETLATASSSSPSAPLTAEAPVLTFDGSTYTADAASDFVIDAQTLTPGGIITAFGTPISLAPGAKDAVVGTSTQELADAVITPADIFTIGGLIVTANPSGFAVAGASVLPGGSDVLVQGTEVSLGLGGTLVLGNSTTVLPTQGASAGAGVFEGGQGRLGVEWLVVWISFGVGFGGMGFVW